MLHCSKGLISTSHIFCILFFPSHFVPVHPERRQDRNKHYIATVRSALYALLPNKSAQTQSLKHKKSSKTGGALAAIFCWGEMRRKEANVPKASKHQYIYLSLCEVKKKKIIILFLQAN